MQKYILVDMEKKEVVCQFQAEGEDAAISLVFKLYNPPPDNFNLYELEVDVDENWDFIENAKSVYLPSEITEDGDYIFEGNRL